MKRNTRASSVPAEFAWDHQDGSSTFIVDMQQDRVGQEKEIWSPCLIMQRLENPC